MRLNNTLGVRATKVMDQLVDGLDGDNTHRKLDSERGYMPTVVEWVGRVDLGDLYSVAHYGEQNGDLMRDPDMVFVRTGCGWMPVSYRNDYLGTQREALVFDNGAYKGKRPRELASQAKFARTWMQNIRQQQGLK